jgi:hypothetical protein
MVGLEGVAVSLHHHADLRLEEGSTSTWSVDSSETKESAWMGSAHTLAAS